MELAVDLIEAQIKAALFGNPKSEWGDLFKRFCYQVKRSRSQRGGQTGNGVRFAARRLTLSFSLAIFDVTPGVPVPEGHPIRDFIVLLRKQGAAVNMLDIAGTFEELLAMNSEAPSWRQAQARLGMSTQSIKALNVDGVPVPWPGIEKPPLDDSDKNEQPPETKDIGLGVQSVDDAWQS